MVVQTLADTSRRSAPRLGWAVPLVPAAVSGFYLSALVYYQIQHGGTQPAEGWLQGAVVGLYGFLGFVPAFMLALLVFVWSTIWYVSGRVTRPWIRAARVLGLTAALTLLIGLQDAASQDVSGGGVLGAFLAVRLESVVGYVLGTLLAAVAVLVALLLATDMIFYRYFEPLTRPVSRDKKVEDGVEDEAVQDMKDLRLDGGFASGPAVAAQPASTTDAGWADGVDLTDPDAPEEPVEAEDAPPPRSSWRDRVSEQRAESADGDHDGGEDFGIRVIGALETDDEVEDDPADSQGGRHIDEVAEAEEFEEEEEDSAEEEEFEGEEEDAAEEFEEEEAAEEEEFEGDDEEGEVDSSDVTENSAEPKVEIPRAYGAGASSRQGHLFESVVADGELIAEATELVQQAGRASVTFLQRRLRVSYEQAQELLEALRRQGTVGGEEGEPQGHVLRAEGEA